MSYSLPGTGWVVFIFKREYFNCTLLTTIRTPFNIVLRKFEFCYFVNDKFGNLYPSYCKCNSNKCGLNLGRKIICKLIDFYRPLIHPLLIFTPLGFTSLSQLSHIKFIVYFHPSRSKAGLTLATCFCSIAQAMNFVLKAQNMKKNRRKTLLRNKNILHYKWPFTSCNQHKTC